MKRLKVDLAPFAFAPIIFAALVMLLVLHALIWIFDVPKFSEF